MSRITRRYIFCSTVSLRCWLKTRAVMATDNKETHLSLSSRNEQLRLHCREGVSQMLLDAVCSDPRQFLRAGKFNYTEARQSLWKLGHAIASERYLS